MSAAFPSKRAMTAGRSGAGRGASAANRCRPGAPNTRFALLPIDIPPPETRGNEPRLQLGKRGADATFGLKEPPAPTLCGQ
jgi:hypothetical protein